MCFKNKKAAEKSIDNRDLICTNAKLMESLIILAQGHDQFIIELNKTKERIKYLTPSTEEKVISYDKKIKGLIEDLRIVLTKADREELPPKAENLLMQINLCISDRKALM